VLTALSSDRAEQFRQKCDAVASFLANPFAPTAKAPGSDELNDARLIIEALAPDSIVKSVDFRNLVPVGYSPDGKSSGAGAWLNPTALAGGAADFVVERAKDEMVYTFVTNLGDDVSGIALFRVGFPRSVALMADIEVGTFQSLMPVVRLAVAQDLQEFPSRLMEDSVSAALGLAGKRPYVLAMSLLYRHGLEIHRGVSPAIALANLADEIAASELPKGSPTRLTFRLAGQIAREYNNSDPEDLLEWLKEGESRQMFSAFLVSDLLQQEGVERTSPAGASILESFRDRHGVILQLEQQLEAARLAVQRVQESGLSNSERISRYIGASAAVLQTASIGAGLIPANIAVQGDSIAELRTWLDRGVQLHQELLARDYRALVTWMLSDKSIRTALGERGTTYFVFAANLASADTPEEVSSVLEAASAPVGSYRAKRNQFARPAEWDVLRYSTSPSSYGPFTLGVTAFLGGQIGSERTIGLQNEDDDSFYGLSIPIGLEASLGLPFGSASAFFSVLDVGSFASRRGDDEGVDADAEVGWNQIVAPGLYGFVGFRGVPLVLGYGVQKVSDLRRSGESSQSVDVYRSAFFVGIDVTVFRLF
jgi:hypothetical protein